MIRLITAAMLALSGLAAGSLADGHGGFPERPIMMMVSYGAGGATDYQARIVTKTAGEPQALGMPIAILNRPGNGGRDGWNWFARHGSADGYTLAAYNVPHFIAQSIDGGVAYTIDSFEPIANWGADPAVFVVASDSPFTSMADVMAYAADNPGALTYSGAGLLVGHHIAALQLEKAAGVQMSYSPGAGGGADALKAVISGDVMGGINNLSDAYRAQDAGKVRVLGVFDLSRSAHLPDVPTLRELGYDIDDASVNYRGIMVPKGTPQPIIDKLAQALPAMFADPRVVRQMQQSGSKMRIMSRDEVKAMWAAREATLKELLAGF